MKMRSFPLSSCRKSLYLYQSRNPIENFKEERFGSGVSITDCDSDVEIVVPVTSFDERDVPHKKRHYLVTSSGGSEMLLHNSDACVVCQVSDKCVSGCSEIDCLLSFHQKCLNAELGSSSEEDLANPYCPYCWFNILALREKAVLGAETKVFEYTNLSGDDDNGYSVDTTEIVSDQELQGDKDDDACSSKVLVDNDSDQSNMTLVEETDPEEEYYTGKLQVRDEVEALDDQTDQYQTRGNTSLSGDDDDGYSLETTEIISDQELQGDKDDDDACSSKGEQVQVDKDSGQSNMTLLEETDTEEHHTGTLQVIDEVEALDDETVQDQTRVSTSLSGVENGYSTDIVSDQDLQVDKDSDKSNMPFFDPEEYCTETLQVIHEVKASEDEERVATENFQNDEDDETAQDQIRVNRCAVGEKGDGSGKENDQVHPNENRRQRRRRRRRIALKGIDSEVSSNESTNKPTGEDVTKQITEVAKSKTVRDLSFFSNKDQRRRILWTSEEEEMLKVGVEKFAPEAKMNMPWRKILEMGKNVFHETRTSASLKDKWKNMIRAR